MPQPPLNESELTDTEGHHPCAGCGNVIPNGVTWCGGCTDSTPREEQL